MKNFFFLIAGVFVLVLAVFFFQSINRPATQTGKLKISASFYPIYFFTSQITKDLVEVKNITPSGVEPHDYEPTAKEIAEIESSDLIILNGGGLEPWADKIKDDLKMKKTRLVTVGEKFINKKIEEEGEVIFDPHTWLSPVIAQKEVEIIVNSLNKIDPKNKDYYRKNADDLLEKLTSLDSSYKLGLSNCRRKDVITSHAAFSYLTEEYGLKQLPIAGLSPEEEPSAKQLAKIADFADKNNIKYIFFETLVSPKLSETVASEIGAQTLVLDPIEGISNKDQKAGKNYLTIMKDNLKNLRIALECQ